MLSSRTTMEIYTDGSCIGSSKRYAGYGIWFGENSKLNSSYPILSEGGTNQLAELLAIREALRMCRKVDSIVIKTDSAYSIKCLTEWYKQWEKSDPWRTSKGKEVLHVDIIKDCLKLIRERNENRYETSLVHVKAHNGIPGNDGADLLAKKGAEEAQSRGTF